MGEKTLQEKMLEDRRRFEILSLEKWLVEVLRSPGLSQDDMNWGLSQKTKAGRYREAADDLSRRTSAARH